MMTSIIESMDYNDKHRSHDEKRDIFVANCSINEIAKLSRKEFLHRLENDRSIRTNTVKAFSLFPITETDWTALEKFYVIVEKGDFGEADFSFSEIKPNAKIFGIYIPSNLYDWFANTSLPIIKKQITLYSATVYHFFMGDDRPKNIFLPFYSELKKIIEKYYESNNAELENAYEAAAQDYCHSPVPPILSIKSLCDRSMKIHDGINCDNVILTTAYFTIDDWNHYVLHVTSKYYLWKYMDEAKGPKPKEEEYDTLIDIPEHHLDNIYALNGPGSDKEAWSSWLLTFQQYPIFKSHVFSFLDQDSGNGYVYIIRACISNHYKIGFTANSNIDKRISAHQTSSSERLERIGSFPVSSRKTEKAIHNKFSHRHVRGEWFELTDEEVKDLLSLEWRRRNNIF